MELSTGLPKGGPYFFRLAATVEKTIFESRLSIKIESISDDPKIVITSFLAKRDWFRDSPVIH